MKETDITLLQFIRQNAQMGTVTLSKLKDMLSDGIVKTIIGNQLDEYNEVFEGAGKMLDEAGEEAKNVNGFMQTMAETMIDMQAIADKSSSHIAEMVLLGSTRGVIKILRHLREQKDASIAVSGLAYKLLYIEQTNIEQMKRFL
ncbi:MAG: hypothetical protein IKM44_04985 [Clostridia bacterium]|nr:hypothetical protein [Clostridia bacterium]